MLITTEKITPQQILNIFYNDEKDSFYNWENEDLMVKSTIHTLDYFRGYS